jgi:hypothetical protein
MDIKLSELEAIMGMSIKYFNELSLNNRFVENNKEINKQQAIALSYYDSVVKFLNSKGAIDLNKVPDVKFVTEDSLTKEDDYYDR